MKYITLLFSVLVCIGVSATENSSNGNDERDTLMYRHNSAYKRMVTKPKEAFKGHWAGLDLGVNNFVNTDVAFMELKAAKSLCVSINFLQKSIGLQREKRNLGLVTGLGWEFYNYRTDLPYHFTIDPVSGQTIGRATHSSWNIKKNKITSSFLNVPLLLEVQMPFKNSDRMFYFSAGGYFGVKVGSHTKMVYLSGGETHKEKSRENINLNPIQYGAIVKMGLCCFNIFATYNFSHLYKDDLGPELIPFKVGISLMPF